MLLHYFKSVKIWQSYGHESVAHFRPTLYIFDSSVMLPPMGCIKQCYDPSACLSLWTNSLTQNGSSLSYAMLLYNTNRKPHAGSQTHWWKWPYGHRKWPKRNVSQPRCCVLYYLIFLRFIFTAFWSFTFTEIESNILQTEEQAKALDQKRILAASANPSLMEQAVTNYRVSSVCYFYFILFYKFTVAQNTQSSRQMTVLQTTTVRYQGRKLHLQIP